MKEPALFDLHSLLTAIAFPRPCGEALSSRPMPRTLSFVFFKNAEKDGRSPGDFEEAMAGLTPFFSVALG